MKRTHVEPKAALARAIVRADHPVNALEGRPVYGQTTKISDPVARPRLLARRLARLERRATR